MEIAAASLDRATAYRLMIGLIVPRPIAWVGTVSAEGVDNLAPFSYFMGVASDPPLLAVSIARLKAGKRKDSAQNILSTGVFSVSLVEEENLQPMHQSSGAWSGSEFDAVGIPRMPGVSIAAPRPATARAAMECRLHRHLDLDATDLFVGEVLRFFVDDALLRADAPGHFTVDRDVFHAVARLGGDGYSMLGRFVDIPRPHVSKN